MTQVLTEREAEVILAAAHDLEKRNRRLAAERDEAAERAERISNDLDLLDKELRAKRRQIQQLAQDRNAKRANDPDANTVKDIWAHYKDATGHKGMTLDGERFDVIKQALKIKADQDDPPGVLKRAIDGAARFPFVTGPGERSPTGTRRQRQDHIDLVFRSAKHIEKFCALADDDHEEAPAVPDGSNVVAMPARRRQSHTWSPSPCERALQVVSSEFGRDRVVRHYDRDPAEAARTLGPVPRITEAWAPCPLHPKDMAMMRIRGRGPFGFESKDSVDYSCVRGCDPAKLAEEIRVLEFRQEQRKLPMDLAASVLANGLAGMAS